MSILFYFSQQPRIISNQTHSCVIICVNCKKKVEDLLSNTLPTLAATFALGSHAAVVVGYTVRDVYT
jgi:hypothetical protein